ncbi:MAG: UDP-N-acetylmuramoylalanyl-D-glutamyl-2, 6-diaminopimelate--D-alanyl-D-alanine ligase [Hyphomicrobiales bacterium]|nr:MAG: UDP-N-acetylmuramoylalanyl-D-glutamyl-2, 6-diaminopimelate--D-alanyl-D-alanine ligase [Hyphomicrobiales bacterium]
MADILWPAEELIAGLNGELIAGDLQGADGISIDSRDIAKNDAFFAIKGDLFDGHDYTQKAAENGASVIVVSDIKYKVERAGVAIILVDDVLDSLRRLAMASRARSKAKIVAITGSVGKTTTKEFLRACLEVCGKTHASIKSFNNHWGVPISLARMPKDTQYGVFEIGMNHLDEITPLVAMVQPHVAIITTVAPAHLGHFKDLQQIAQAKAEIFSGMMPDGVAILNRDNEFFEYLFDAAQAQNIDDVQSFGADEQADMCLLGVELMPNSSLVTAAYKGQKFNYEIGSAGLHQVQNSLGLLLAVENLGIDLNKVLPMLANIELSDGRGARVEIAINGGSIVVIDESYNANPASMVAAFSVLGAQQPQQTGRRVVVLGDMLELGIESEQIHAGLAKDILANNIDVVMACGKDMKNCYDLLPHEKQGGFAQSSSLLADIILNSLQPYDVVMIKGSLGSQMSNIVNKLKNSKASA